MFKNAREIFQIFGIRIRIDPSWFIIAALIVWSLSTGYFPETLPDVGRNTLIAISLIAMIGLFVSLIMHELAHSLVARRFNLDVGSITLFIFGGVAELERDPQSAKSEFWIAIAGPVMSLGLGIFFFAVSRIPVMTGSQGAIAALLEYLGLINFVLAGFNLVPAFPMDGGRVLRAFLWHYKQDLLAATRIAGSIGKFFAFVLIFLGVLAFLASQFVVGLWQIMIGLFILGASRAAYEDLLIRHALKDYTVSSLMTRNPWVADVEDSIQCLIDQVMLKHNVSFVPVMEGDRLLGYIDTTMIQAIDQDNWNETRVGDIFAPLDESNTTRAEAKTEDVFNQMVKTGHRKLLIVRNGTLEGVIALADLMTFLSIRSGLGLVKRDAGRQKRYTMSHV